MSEVDRIADLLIEQSKALRESGLSKEADQKIAEAADVLWPGIDSEPKDEPELSSDADYRLRTKLSQEQAD